MFSLGVGGYFCVVHSHFCIQLSCIISLPEVGMASRNTLTMHCANSPATVTQKYWARSGLATCTYPVVPRIRTMYVQEKYSLNILTRNQSVQNQMWKIISNLVLISTKSKQKSSPVQNISNNAMHVIRHAPYVYFFRRNSFLERYHTKQKLSECLQGTNVTIAQTACVPTAAQMIQSNKLQS